VFHAISFRQGLKSVCSLYDATPWNFKLHRWSLNEAKHPCGPARICQTALMIPMKALPILFVLFSIPSASAAQRPDLTGAVVNDAGRAISNARVFIYTAGPKVGVGTL